LREKHILVLYPEQLYTDWYGGLRDYLVSALVPVFLITGEDAIQKIVMLKNDLRRRYARSRHQQVFHSPFPGEEWKRNMRFFREILGPDPV
jgi:nucleoside diphosphate kinase